MPSGMSCLISFGEKKYMVNATKLIKASEERCFRIVNLFFYSFFSKKYFNINSINTIVLPMLVPNAILLKNKTMRTYNHRDSLKNQLSFILSVNLFITLGTFSMKVYLARKSIYFK